MKGPRIRPVHSKARAVPDVMGAADTTPDRPCPSRGPQSGLRTAPGRRERPSRPPRPWKASVARLDYRPGVPPPGSESRPGPARYLQQVQLGCEAPRQTEEAVTSVGEGHSYDRPTFPRTHQTFAAPHRRPAKTSRPPTLADPGQARRPRASELDDIDCPRPLRPRGAG